MTWNETHYCEDKDCVYCLMARVRERQLDSEYFNEVKFHESIE